jgi:hypothetical protein
MVLHFLLLLQLHPLPPNAKMSPAVAAGIPDGSWEMKGVVNMIKALESRRVAA